MQNHNHKLVELRSKSKNLHSRVNDKKMNFFNKTNDDASLDIYYWLRKVTYATPTTDPPHRSKT